MKKKKEGRRVGEQHRGRAILGAFYLLAGLAAGAVLRTQVQRRVA